MAWCSIYHFTGPNGPWTIINTLTIKLSLLEKCQRSPNKTNKLWRSLTTVKVSKSVLRCSTASTRFYTTKLILDTCKWNHPVMLQDVKTQFHGFASQIMHHVVGGILTHYKSTTLKRSPITGACSATFIILLHGNYTTNVSTLSCKNIAK